MAHLNSLFVPTMAQNFADLFLRNVNAKGLAQERRWYRGGGIGTSGKL